MDAVAEVDQIIPPDAVAAAIAKSRADRAAGRVSLSKPGEISREVIYAIHEHVDPEAIGKAIKKMLDAKRTLKNGQELEDTRTMEAGIKLYLAYMVGTPIQRSEIVQVNVDADSALGLEERLRHSPALRSMFRKMLDNVESATTDSPPPTSGG